jgi:hypothetical protein
VIEHRDTKKQNRVCRASNNPQPESRRLARECMQQRTQEPNGEQKQNIFGQAYDYET